MLNSLFFNGRAANFSRTAVGVLGAAALHLATTSVFADEGGAELVRLLNEYRQSGSECAGQSVSSPGPLAPNERLSAARLDTGERLLSALQSAGYRASRARAMAVSGPQEAEAALGALARQYCTELLSNRYAEVGVSRTANRWQVVLAKPLLSDELRDWQDAGKAILEKINQVRSEAQNCGPEFFEAARPLRWSETLGASALAHSRDMADQGYFSHISPDGTNVGDRARRDGYRWSSIGENIAAGQSSPEQVVSGWMQSPGHCSTIMNPDFTEMGAAYSVNEASPSGIYWTQVFGRPR
jgi:uncharacterized protein YkwD